MAVTAAELLRAKARREQALRGPSRTVPNRNNGNVPSVVATPPAWNEADALELFRATVERLARDYPPGAWGPWEHEHRPDLETARKQAERALDDARRRGDRKAFEDAAQAFETTARALFAARLVKP